MKVLADVVKTKPRFARSANVERDLGALALEGYVPTGRAVDVVKRVAHGLLDARAGRTFSITGPHGGGKSSLAVFVAALLAKDTAQEYKSALALLRVADPDTADLLVRARRHIGVSKTGFVTATAAAHTESVTKTVARALREGAERAFGADHGTTQLQIDATERAVLEHLSGLCGDRPVLLVIDEFGKNLEAYARSKGDGDPYLLQEIAEATQGSKPLPLIVITMQHLAFDDYVQDTSAARRREWAKVQGRFQDIPYVETAEQSRRLIVESIEQSPVLERRARTFVDRASDQLSALNLREVMNDAAGAVPLHPATLAVLPELCSRYGQNERTLFSFIAGHEPYAVPEVLKKIKWDGKSEVPLIGLEHIYDYFVESGSSALGVSSGASRWLEIETRIRDTPGLTAPELRALKSIGLLNLVSTGGKVRASRDMLHFCLSPYATDANEVDAVLDGLAGRSLVAYRTFSDEYRIWQGSDYDLRRAIASAKRQIQSVALEDLLDSAAQLQPVVAGRHSQRSGVLRIFGQRFASSKTVLTLDPEWDGAVVYWVTGDAEGSVRPTLMDSRPVVVVEPDNLEAVREKAIDAASLQLALQSAQEESADWVAVRELAERAAAAQQLLLTAVSDAWKVGAQWVLVNSPDTTLDASAGLSSLLSTIADEIYPATPQLRNEMIARRALTSQGAKARRQLIDAMIAHRDLERFGIEGYGPERAVYEALFRWTGIHRKRQAEWSLGAPSDESWKLLWADLNTELDRADDERVRLDRAFAVATKPPYGLKDGVLPLLAVAILLARGDEIALYEHGSLVLEIDDAVAERLAKNPSHFAVRNSATQGGARRTVVGALAERLQIPGSRGQAPTFLNVTTALFRELRVLPPYTQKTKASLSAEAREFRDAFHTATEPDVLVFETLPDLFGMGPFKPRARSNTNAAKAFAERVAATVLELRSAYDELLGMCASKLAEATSMPADLSELHSRLGSRAVELDGHVLEARLSGFVGALARDLDERAWLENVAMVVSEGQAPRVWTDAIAERFPLRVAEIGGALRRTEALLYDNRARNSDSARFTATRVTLTHPDGSNRQFVSGAVLASVH